LATPAWTAAADRFESIVYRSVPHTLALAPGVGLNPVRVNASSLPNCCC
jgi:hypothetical protein